MARYPRRHQRHRRQPRDIWNETRMAVWLRDGGKCQGPYCTDLPPLMLDECQIDHIIPLSSGGTNHHSNLRVLCERCHVLRADKKHRGMIGKALAKGVIPPDWRALVWE